jgi:hypothetical protein
MSIASGNGHSYLISLITILVVPPSTRQIPFLAIGATEPVSWAINHETSRYSRKCYKVWRPYKTTSPFRSFIYDHSINGMTCMEYSMRLSRGILQVLKVSFLIKKVFVYAEVSTIGINNRVSVPSWASGSMIEWDSCSLSLFFFWKNIGRAWLGVSRYGNW